MNPEQLRREILRIRAVISLSKKLSTRRMVSLEICWKDHIERMRDQLRVLEVREYKSLNGLYHTPWKQAVPSNAPVGGYGAIN
jgi:hypothetical protein